MLSQHEKTRIWETAKVISTGAEKKNGEIFGHYALYKVLCGQYERGELGHEQLKILGLDRVIVPAGMNQSKKPGKLIIARS